MSGTFHSVSADDLEGLALARLISRLGVSPGSACTFLWRDGDLAPAWRDWLDNCFAPLLAPAIVAIHRLGCEIRPAEICEFDHTIDRTLSEAERLRSLAAGRPFLEGKEEMRANREWSRFAERVVRGETPGHAATLFALQAALYHLPLAPTLAAYAWFEIESGLPRGDFRDREGTRGEVLEVFASAIPHVKVAMTRDFDDSSEDHPRLRAL